MMEMIPPPTQDDPGTIPTPPSIKSDDSTPPPESGRGSPPPNCAICLGTCRNKSYTDSCLHQFCFKCLLTWSKVKAECPLCKQNFKSIIHNVRSNHQYEEYLVAQLQTEERIEERIDIDALTTATRRFRYRTTLTLPRRNTLAIQRLLSATPTVGPTPGAAGSGPGRTLAFRRTVYRHRLWARPLPDLTGRYRDCTPDFYRYNDSQMHRLVPWLSRELSYLLNENVGHISYVIGQILELLPLHHITSPEFHDAMRRYLGERTEHFLHELHCFASTPYDLTGYDRHVHYTTDLRIVDHVISSTDTDSNDSDIMLVSSTHPTFPAPSAGPSRVLPIETISQSDSDGSSSEVVVVGYVKPPRDRTPEVVDLLHSDSDVELQEITPAPSNNPAPTNLVKLTMTQPRATRRRTSASSGSAYTPPPMTSRISSSFSEESSLSISTPSSISSSENEQQSLDKTYSPRTSRKRSRKSRKRAHRSRSRSLRRRERRGDRSERRKKESARKRKSESGKGVKSSKRRRQEEGGETPPPLDMPGPSVSRRLRSVVNVMSSLLPTMTMDEFRQSLISSEIPECPLNSGAVSVRPVDNRSDSEDDLPLNLSIKRSPS